MPNLVIPNVIANGVAADGDAVGANFAAIAAWANGNVGNDNYSAAAADRLALTKLATPRHVVKEIISTENYAGTYFVVGNFVTNTWYTHFQYTNQYPGQIIRLVAWTPVAAVAGTWEIQILLNGAAAGTILTPIVGAGGEVAQAEAVSIAAGNTIAYQIRRTSAGADIIGRHRFEAWLHLDHRAT